MHKYAILAAGILFGSSAALVSAQSLDDLNIQIHGYATQGFLYTNQNNVFTTTSTNGSPAWNEDVVNLGAAPMPKLRIGIQARYFLLGNYGNTITLDWAQLDYRPSDLFGVRVGKVKTPFGLFNETQDIDPSYMFALLPQGPYSIASRNSQLSEYGGVAYGTLNGHQAGKLEYRGWDGVRAVTKDDGNFLGQRESGTTLPNGVSGVAIGAALHWRLPIEGLMIGASDLYVFQKSGPIINTPTTGASQTTTNGTETVSPFSQPFYFFKYEHGKFMLAGEFWKSAAKQYVALTGKATTEAINDNTAWYPMLTYKVTDKLTAGSYYTQEFNTAAKLGPARYLKDWVVSGRYDFNQFLYAKAEEHFIEGTLTDFDTTLNPSGLKPTTKLTILKMGVSF
jgi:hypothetical protein